ncbi:MAG: TonB family protein [Vicinamibacterales bacterium]
MTEWVLINVLGYSVQLAALVGAVAVLVRILSLHDSRAELALWQGGFLLSGLPLALMWTTSGADAASAVPRISVDALTVAVPVPGRDVPWSRLVVFALVGGVAVRLARLALGWMRISGWVASSSRVTLEEVGGGESLQPVRTLAPDIRVSDVVPGPVTVGLWRPVVLLPRAFLSLPLPTRRAVLGHELLHARRRDPLRVLIEELWRACLWFHPAAHVLVSRVELAREMWLDRQTIALTGDKVAYAQALLAFGSATPGPAVPAFIRRSHAARRIAGLEREVETMSKQHRLVVVSIAVTIVAGATASAARLAPMPGRASVLSTSAGQAPLSFDEAAQKPRVLHEVKPEYTKEALDAKIQGQVVLRVVVEADGSVGRVSVVESLDDTHGLDRAAAEAASLWRFEPGRKDGKPVPVSVELEFVFTLR